MKATKPGSSIGKALADYNGPTVGKIKIYVNDRERMSELVCDGVLVSTPAGSSAYNLSVHGPVLPLNSNVLALTPISAFRPRRWRGAILPHTAVVRFVLVEADKLPRTPTVEEIFNRAFLPPLDELPKKLF